MALPCLGAVAVLLAADTTYWLYKYETEVKARFFEHSQRMTDTTAKAVSEALWQFDRLSAQRSLQSFRDLPGFQAAVIYTDHGAFVSFRMARTEALDEVAASVNGVDFAPQQHGDSYFFSSAIRHYDAGQIGYIVASLNKDVLAAELSRARLNALFVAASSFAVVGVIFLIVANL